MPIFRRDDLEWDEGVVPSSFTSGGVRGANMGYRKTNSTTWTPFWSRSQDATPPATISAVIQQGSRNTFNVTVQVPAPSFTTKKVKKVIVKVGIAKMPTGPTVQDSTFYSQTGTTTGTGEKFSEWFTDQWSAGVTFGVPRTKVFAPPASGVSVPLNTDITFAVWTQDNEFQWSDPVITTVRTLKSTDLPAGQQIFKTAVMPVDADFYVYKTGSAGWGWHSPTYADHRVDTRNAAWNSGAYGRIFQGGDDRFLGCFFYGTVLRTVMRQGELRSAKLRVYRADASNWGRQASVYLSIRAINNAAHPGRTTSWASMDFAAVEYDEVLIGARGTFKDVELPTRVKNRFLDSGEARSLAFLIPEGAETSNRDTDPRFVGIGYKGGYTSAGNPSPQVPSGCVVVEWAGYTNPWPNATPGVAAFAPLNPTQAEKPF